MTAELSHPDRSPAARRPVLRKAAIYAILATAAGLTLLFFIVRPGLPAAWSTPGSSELYLVGVLGAVLALMPFAFSLAKRSGASENPPSWFIAHVVAACLGMALLLIHSGGHFGRPPALLLASGLFLIVQGAWARIHLPHRVSNLFGSKYRAIVGVPAVDKDSLRALIDEKRSVLQTLDPMADEAQFSPTLSHWCRRPFVAARYAKLARAEMALIGQRKSVPPMLAYWRALHIAVALLFLLGLIVHVVTVTFFAGYVADGGPITWWHLAAWGAP